MQVICLFAMMGASFVWLDSNVVLCRSVFIFYLFYADVFCLMDTFFFFLRIRRPPSSPLFPYTPLFRSHDPYPSASCFTSRTTPLGPRITRDSWRGGTVVYLRAYTSIGSSPQWSGWKCDRTTWVT